MDNTKIITVTSPKELKKMKKLVLFTNIFPYSILNTEHVFISPELKFLAKYFDQITIIPENVGDEMVCIQNENIKIDTTYASGIKIKTSKLQLLKQLRHFFTPIGILSVLSDLKRMKNIKHFAIHIITIDRIFQFQKWLKNFILKEDVDLHNTLFYTYWFCEATSALALFSNKNIKIITRAHGFDIYDERVTYRSMYFRNKTLKHILSVFTASVSGQHYLQLKYPRYSSKIEVQYLGAVKKNNGFTKTNTDLQITFFTSARAEPVKRLTLSARLIMELAKQIPEYDVRWIHVGDGKEMDMVKSICQSQKIPNLKIEFKGKLSNEQVHDIYINETIDWAILTSSSEGGCPISIVESLSYGVPVIATSVGGIPEIVTENNGILLSKDPSESEFIAKMTTILQNKELYASLKKQAYADYLNKFNAEKNHEYFVKKIIQFL